MAKKTKKNSSLPSNDNNGCILDRNQARRDAKPLGLSKADLPNSIKEVISTLTQAGFEAYIVGGGVRDAMLGLKPKDFDAVTNATPNQIKDVFGKRCRIIGRRFQLCHVYSGRDMIEVATFRAPPKDKSFTTDEGMLMRDNVWGDIFQDVVRRDFSINALYYQPFDGFVYDFCGGLDDIKNRTIRLLGDSQRRIEEDPVRLLRALRFKAKLDFKFDAALEAQFNPQNWALLAQVSPHRLYDETQKMFTGGYLIALLPLLFDYAAFESLLFYPPAMITPLIEQVTVNTDKRITSGKSINPAFFYAALLWENYLYLLNKFKKNTPFVEAQIQAANKVMDKQRQHTAMPKFAEQFIKDIWLLQPRLAEPRKKNLAKLFENPRFRAGFDFLMLREQVEAKNQQLEQYHGSAITLDQESTNGMGHWWAWFQTLGSKQQQQAIDEFDINHVKLRFANIVRQDGHLADEPNTNGYANNKYDELRAQVAKAPTHHLSEQQQLEKDQLSQLSLAHGRAVTQPAKSPWRQPLALDENNTNTAINDKTSGKQTELSAHQNMTAEKGTSRSASDKPNRHKRERQQVKSQLQAYDMNIDASELDDNIPTKATRRHKALNANRQVNNVPMQRQRRAPSSTLSVREQRHMAALVDDTTATKPSLDSHSGDANTVPTLMSSQPVNEANRPAQDLPATQSKRTRGRQSSAKAQVATGQQAKAKAKHTNEDADITVAKVKPTRQRRKKTDPSSEQTTIANTISESLPPVTAIPKKRSRKQVATTTPVEQPSVSEDKASAQPPTTRPKRRPRVKKVADASTEQPVSENPTEPSFKDQ